MKGPALLAWLASAGALPAALLGACAQEPAPLGAPVTYEPDAGGTLYDGAPLPGYTECKVNVTVGLGEPDRNHLPICTPIPYATNPPSGGNHWPVWAAYDAYRKPVPREMYVHDEEHGAVVLAYKCDGGCPEVVAALQAAIAAAPADAFCLASGGVPSARFVLTPDPLLDTPIAAAAWGATYTATCIQPESLAKFIETTYGHGPEMLCAQGTDPAIIEAMCADAGDGG